jgi:hypothetical protein
MKKVVINGCYGGFSLSDKAMMLYAEKRGIDITPVDDTGLGGSTFFKCKPENLPEILRKAYLKLSDEERRGPYSEAYSEIGTLSSRDFERDDPCLVKVVEELGDCANGSFASLNIVEIPDDVEWEIAEYDGIEWVAEKHRTWN